MDDDLPPEYRGRTIATTHYMEDGSIREADFTTDPPKVRLNAAMVAVIRILHYQTLGRADDWHAVY